MLFKVLLLLSLTSFIHGYSGCGNGYLGKEDGIGLKDCEKECFEKKLCVKWSYNENEYEKTKSCVFQKSVGKGCKPNKDICFLELMYGNNWKGTKNCGSGKKELCRVQYKTEMESDDKVLAPHVNSCGACAKLCSSKSETCKYWYYVDNECYTMGSFSKSKKSYNGGIGGNNRCGKVDSKDFCKGQ